MVVGYISRGGIVGWRNWGEGCRMEEQGRVVGSFHFDFAKNPHYRSFSSLC
jgi:hypothetical protein